jgi:hypothetical protein
MKGVALNKHTGKAPRGMPENCGIAVVRVDLNWLDTHRGRASCWTGRRNSRGKKVRDAIVGST